MGHAQRPAVSAVYGRYQTLFRIASGGMAEVYAARVLGEAGFQKLVALKRMLPHLTDDERFVNMFMDEGKLAANIDSPNVVSTLDLGRADDGSLYLVMELVVGTTLSTLLRNAAKDGQSCPIDVACEIIAQAAQGLHDAHEAKTPFGAPLQLVHRDISPQNILVGMDGRVRITDFGVARAVLRRTKTSTGEFKGKLSYFSPEQCADKNLDRRSDIFSLGVVAWETLTTRRLFHAENPLAVLERVTRMTIPLAHEVNPEVPPAVSEVVAKALERDRDRRFSTALELSQALRAASRASQAGGRDRITELVERYGGDQLERVQDQLRESLANASAPEPDVDPGPRDLESGIITRPDEASSPSSSSSSIPRFSPPGDSVEADAAPAPAGKGPLYAAVVVAVLGLGGGAAIGIAASGLGHTEEVPHTAAPADVSEIEDPVDEPVTQLDPELTVDDPSDEPDAPEVAAVEPDPPPQPSTVTGRRRRGRSAGGPTEDPSAEQRAEQQRAEQQRAEQQRAEQQRAEQQRAERQRLERERAQRERETEAQPPSGGRGNGLRSVDDFMNELGR